MINLITLAGDGLRFSKEGFKIPKPLIHIDGEPMIFKSVDSLPKPEKYVFVCKQDHIDNFDISNILKKRYPNSEIVAIDKTTDGQACTAEIGIKESSITGYDELLISCCDYGLQYDINEFDKRRSDSDIVIWSTVRNKAFSKNPQSYSWLVTHNNKFRKVYVKNHVFNDSYNHQAIVGTFYFKYAEYFLRGASLIYEYGIKSNNEYYIDNIFNPLNEYHPRLDIDVFNVNEYMCWGTPNDLSDYENSIL